MRLATIQEDIAKVQETLQRLPTYFPATGEVCAALLHAISAGGTRETLVRLGERLFFEAHTQNHVDIRQSKPHLSLYKWIDNMFGLTVKIPWNDRDMWDDWVDVVQQGPNRREQDGSIALQHITAVFMPALYSNDNLRCKASIAIT